MEALKAKNKALKKELGKLEKLAASIDNKDSKAKVEQKLKDVNAVKAAFDHYDADGSGFIDKAEFVGLSSDLGELLDDDELVAAIKEIDVSGDGKISFNEFIRWWNTDKKSTSKSAAKIALLKTKLKAKEFKAVSSKLVRQLSNVKPEDNEFVKHRIALNLGDVKDVKTSINAAVSFAAIAEKDLLGMPAIAKIVFSVADGVTSDKLDADKKTVEELLTQAQAAGIPGKCDVDAKAKSFTVTVGVPEDPFALAPQLGLDLQAFIKEAAVSLELPFGVSELTDGRDGKLADLLALKFELKLQFRKALVHTLANALPGAKEAAWAAFLENFNLAFALGSVKDLLTSCQPPAGMQMHGMPPGMALVARAAEYALADGGKKAIADAYVGLWKGIGSEGPVVDVITALKKTLDQLTQIQYHTGSGVVITINLKNAFPLKAIPVLKQ